jgi:hypothetical protein
MASVPELIRTDMLEEGVRLRDGAQLLLGDANAAYLLLHNVMWTMLGRRSQPPNVAAMDAAFAGELRQYFDQAPLAGGLA